jgi:DNA polymerase-3 subunit delta
MEGAKPGDAGGRVLRRYTEFPPPDTVLLVLAGRQDASAQKTKWFQALARAGVWIQTWAVDSHRLPAWIDRRMRSRGLRPDREAIALLADRVEGNLLAAAQEVDRLAVTLGGGAVNADTVLTAVSDSARFDIFDLTDAALGGEGAARILRILTGLRSEGVEPVLIGWALAREIRTLCAMAVDLGQGLGTDAVLTRHRVWARRKPMMKKALGRYDARRWRSLLSDCADLDRVIKGQRTGSAWNELLHLSLDMAGQAGFVAPRDRWPATGEYR